MGIEFKTKTEVVHERIREEIIAGKIKPGQRLVISNLAKDFGHSEIPVREAIRQLESEGIVQVTPHVGAVVREINEKEFLEIYIIRIELEVLATRLAVPHIGEKALSKLNSLIQKAEIAIDEGKHEKLGTLNKHFHLSIYQTGPYSYLYRMILGLWEKFELSNNVFAYVPDRAVPSWYEHRQIVEAIKNKDADLAAELVREQKLRTKTALERFLKVSNSFAQEN